MKRVLVINEGYSDNLGDQAINESLHFLLQQNHIKEINFQDFTKNIQKLREININTKESKKSFFLPFIKTLFPNKMKFIIKNIVRIIENSKNKYDIVFIGGGQLIMGNASFPIAMFLWISLLKLFGNNNIYLISVGAASDIKFNFLDKLLFKYSFKNVKNIYVRDKKSMEIMKFIFKRKVEFIYDLAFIHNQIHQTNFKNENVPKIYSAAMSIMPLKTYLEHNIDQISKTEYYDSWIQLVKNNNIQLNDLVLFYTTQGDRNAVYDFQDYILDMYNIQLEVIETNTIDKLITLYDNTNIVISGRMHALILGLVYDCNIITYFISDKLKEFDSLYIQDKKDVKNIQQTLQITIKNILKGHK